MFKYTNMFYDSIILLNCSILYCCIKFQKDNLLLKYDYSYRDNNSYTHCTVV